MSDYCAIAEVKAHFGFDASKDVAITADIPRVTAIFNRALDRDLRETVYTEVRDGTDSRSIRLYNYPIISITSIKEDDISVDLESIATYLIEGIIKIKSVTDDTPRIYRSLPLFTRGDRNYEIIYTAGYTTIPAEVNFAAILMVGYIVNNPTVVSSEIISEKIGNYQYRKDPNAVKESTYIPKNIWTMIEDYKRRDIESSMRGT